MMRPARRWRARKFGDLRPNHLIGRRKPSASRPSCWRFLMPHDRRARQAGPTHSGDLLPAQDRFPDARRPAAEGAGDSRALGGEDIYGALRKQARGTAEIRAARRAALRQRQHPYRPRAQQDPEGSRRPLAADARARTPTTCRAGTATACRSNGRSRRRTIARRARRSPTSAIPPRWSPSASECRAYAEHWLDVQREEFKRLGVVGDWDHPYSTMSFPAEAQIAREIHKFAANGLLYRGSKPVMWSVVEKTALAEAEVEYEEHTSATRSMWRFHAQCDECRLDSTAEVELERALSSGPRRRGLSPATARSRYSRRIAYGALSRRRGARRAIGPNGRRERSDSRRRARWRDVIRSAQGSTRSNALRDVSPPTNLRRLDLRPSAARSPIGYDFRRAAPRRRPRHRRRRHRLRPYRAGPRPRGFRDLDGATAACSPSAASTRASPTRSTKTAPTPTRRPASRASASHRQGRQGDANEAVIKALDRGAAKLRRARQAQAPISRIPGARRSRSSSATRRNGSSPWTSRSRRAGRTPARNRAHRHRRHALGAGDRREPHPRHGQRQARLGDEPPARLGRADRGVRQQGDPRAAQRRARQRAHRRGLRSRKAPTPGTRAGAAARFLAPDYDAGRLREDRRHSRRLVRFRLDACLRARRRAPLSRPRRHQAQASTAAPTR